MTLLGGGGKVQCHQMTQGEEGVCQGVTWHFFHNFWAIFLYFWLFLRVLRTLFLEKLKSLITQGGGGGTDQCHKITQEGGGSKISQKSVKKLSRIIWIALINYVLVVNKRLYEKKKNFFYWVFFDEKRQLNVRYWIRNLSFIYSFSSLYMVKLSFNVLS